MSEDLNKKIQQVAELLGQENMPDNVKGLLSMLIGSLDKKDAASEKEDHNEKGIETQEEKKEAEKNCASAHIDIEQNINPETMNKVKSHSGSLRNGNDPRINLLYAIKPFMNNNRQKKIGNCIQILQMTNIAKLMDNKEK